MNKKKVNNPFFINLIDINKQRYLFLKYALLFIISLVLILSLNIVRNNLTMTNSLASTQSLTNPSLGMGLNGITDWSTQLPFINHFKSARNWIGHQPNSYGYDWGGVPEEEFNLDENNYPISLPVVDGKTAAMGTVLFTDMEAEAVEGGRYVVLYEGEGTIEYTLSGDKIESESEPGRDVIDFTPQGNLLGINITETDPNNTGNYIRNIRVIREDQLDLYEAGATFNPEWIDKIEDFRSLRFMDWMNTNNSDVSQWSDRTQVDDASWTSGAPLEVMIELANQTGTDPWFTIPHQATDEYIQNFAATVKEQLDPDLKAHFEFSNEVWNWQFEQAQYAHREGQERWGEDVGTAWVQWYGMRSAQMAQILDEVYGEEADDRLVKVISTQTGYKALAKYILEAPKWVAEGNPAPYTLFDAFGITGYFSGRLGHSTENYETVKSWIQDDREAAFDKALQALGGNDTLLPDPGDSVLDTIEGFKHYNQVATDYGLDLVTYEAGTHVVGVPGEAKNDEEFTEFLIELNRRPEMGDLYDQLLQGWKDAGGTLFNQFVDVGRASKHGSWGALAHLNDSTSRWESVTSFNETNSGWWESRSEGTFDQGLILEGDEGNNVLVGTVEDDFLLGGAGDDTLEPGTGNDGINGGDGIDSLVLDQNKNQYEFLGEGDGIRINGENGESDFVTEVELFQFADGEVVEVDLEKLQGISFISGLQRRWSFDDQDTVTVADESFHDRYGWLENDPTSVKGVYGQGMSFDGVDDRVIDHNQGSDINGLNAITVSLWVKSDEVETDNGIFSTTETNGHDTHLGMRYDDSGWAGGGDDVIKLSLRTSEGSIQYESASDVQTTDWQHLAMVWESGSSLQLYINGELDTPTYGGGEIGGSIEQVSQLALGQSQRSDETWDGAIDEFQVYDRVLNGDEIAQLFTSEVLEKEVITDLSFDEGSGATVADSTENHHDSLLQNNPSWVDGISGNAVGFDGTDDLVRDNANGSYLNGLNAITVSLWVKSDEVETDNGIFSTTETNGHDTHLGMRYDDAGWAGGGDDVIKLSLRTSEGSIQYESASDVQTTDWQHLAMVWESGSSLQLYINGELDTPTYGGGEIGGSIEQVSQLALGQSQRSDETWDGAIDQFQLFNYALSGEEIAQLA